MLFGPLQRGQAHTIALGWVRTAEATPFRHPEADDTLNEFPKE